MGLGVGARQKERARVLGPMLKGHSGCLSPSSDGPGRTPTLSAGMGFMAANRIGPLLNDMNVRSPPAGAFALAALLHALLAEQSFAASFAASLPPPPQVDTTFEGDNTVLMTQVGRRADRMTKPRGALQPTQPALAAALARGAAWAARHCTFPV